MKLNELKPSVGMELAKEAGEKGIEVLRVVAAGSAESAGITRGSCVNAINGVALVSTLDFITEVLSLSLLCRRAPSFCRRVQRPHASRTSVPTNLQLKQYRAGDVVDVRIWDASKEGFRTVKLQIGARVCSRPPPLPYRNRLPSSDRLQDMTLTEVRRIVAENAAESAPEASRPTSGTVSFILGSMSSVFTDGSNPIAVHR